MLNNEKIKQKIGIQLSFFSEIKLKKKRFLVKNISDFLAIEASILSPRQDGNVHTYATTKEVKTMKFRINSQNIKQAFGIQETLITEIKSQKERFLPKEKKKKKIFSDFCVLLKPLLGWECAYVCHD